MKVGRCPSLHFNDKHVGYILLLSTLSRKIALSSLSPIIQVFLGFGPS